MGRESNKTGGGGVPQDLESPGRARTQRRWEITRVRGPARRVPTFPLAPPLPAAPGSGPPSSPPESSSLRGAPGAARAPPPAPKATGAPPAWPAAPPPHASPGLRPAGPPGRPGPATPPGRRSPASAEQHPGPAAGLPGPALFSRLRLALGGRGSRSRPPGAGQRPGPESRLFRAAVTRETGPPRPRPRPPGLESRAHSLGVRRQLMGGFGV